MSSDIYCPTCGEPLDPDELHEIEGLTYREASAAFRSAGCTAIGLMHGEGAPVHADAARVVYDLLGDDLDAAAAELSSWVQYHGQSMKHKEALP